MPLSAVPALHRDPMIRPGAVRVLLCSQFNGSRMAPDNLPLTSSDHRIAGRDRYWAIGL